MCSGSCCVEVGGGLTGGGSVGGVGVVGGCAVASSFSGGFVAVRWSTAGVVGVVGAVVPVFTVDGDTASCRSLRLWILVYNLLLTESWDL